MKQDFIAPIMGIRRHRILSDGSGVRTLVGFYGCPLDCKYCLNPECHSIPESVHYLSSKDLLDTIEVDSIYFKATGGGVTFGGGEPLMYADYIADFINQAPSEWKYSCETSLNILESRLMMVLNVINEFIVDIKDMSLNIYQRYTGVDNNLVLSNLKKVADLKLCDKFVIRVPSIPIYNCGDDIIESKKALRSLGFSRFEDLPYVTNVKGAKNEEKYTIYNGINWGKITCEVLKRIRNEIARHHGIVFRSNECREMVCHTGTCPICEQELKDLTYAIKKPRNKYLKQRYEDNFKPSLETTI